MLNYFSSWVKILKYLGTLREISKLSGTWGEFPRLQRNSHTSYQNSRSLSSKTRHISQHINKPGMRFMCISSVLVWVKTSRCVELSRFRITWNHCVWWDRSLVGHRFIHRSQSTWRFCKIRVSITPCRLICLQKQNGNSNLKISM